METEDLFHINYKNKDPKTGRILVSYPTLNDFYFKRSVILITEHTENGTVGFVLNKEIKVPINNLLEDFPEIDAHISIGGPVSPETLHFIHRLGEVIPGTVHVVDDIYWGGDFEYLKSLYLAQKVKKEDIQFFLGYSGWSGGQLDEELKKDSWLVMDNKEIGILQKKAINWKNIIGGMGENFRFWQNFPEDPTLN